MQDACPACHAPWEPGEAFCGNCGLALAVSRQGGPVPAPPGSRRLAAIAGTLFLMAALAGGAWWYRGVGDWHVKPAPKPPPMPPRMADLLKELPVGPAKPASWLFKRRLPQGPGEKLWPLEHSLPPIGEPALLELPDAVVSVGCRANPGDPLVGVSVFAMRPRNGPSNLPSVGRTFADHFAAAWPGATLTELTAQGLGGAYLGWRLQWQLGEWSQPAVAIMLEKISEPIMVVIYAPKLETLGLAERLAANVGAGQGIEGLPELQAAVGFLPASVLGGLELKALRIDACEHPTSCIDPPFYYRIHDAPIPAVEGRNAKAGGEQTAPARLTGADYLDSDGQKWEVRLWQYGGTRAAAAWTGLKETARPALRPIGWTGADALGDSGRLAFRKGPYVGLVFGPKSVSAYDLARFISSRQLL